MKSYSFLLGLVILMACGADGDNQGTEYAPNMYHAVSYEPLKQITDKDAGNWVSSLDDGQGEYYSSNPLNPYGMNMREPVANTVRRSKNGYLPYRIPKDSLSLAATSLKNPLDSTAAVINDGKVLYGKFCGHCHGENGKADGKVAEVFGGVPVYSSPAVKNLSEGHIFHVITHGVRRMGAHGSQLSIEERWKIVRYVQVLQKQ
ncbi:c-type cytochrome [Splendidivirga corallicola]|uniref:c-type cytochrome n=1 Tax=Splendidivirga corallicola TaxID=3051826 RepID=UPI003211A2C7